MTDTLDMPRRQGASRASADNAYIARQLERVADLLDGQGANPFRVQAWRGGASRVRESAQPMAELLASEGLEGLERLPGIGTSLARAIREIVETGSLSTVHRLEGSLDAVALLATVPGIGHELATRIHDTLAIETLEELEAAAHDGRLDAIPGFGRKRVAGVREALATRLRRRRLRRDAVPPLPSVAEILDVDREYREKAAAGALPTIAPRRFNPERKAWLPVLHTDRDAWHFTALYSNTALAHRLGRTQDWVVMYFDGHDGEHQCTVVTETTGRWRGHRMVRGRERECEELFLGGG